MPNESKQHRPGVKTQGWVGKGVATCDGLQPSVRGEGLSHLSDPHHPWKHTLLGPAPGFLTQQAWGLPEDFLS